MLYIFYLLFLCLCPAHRNSRRALLYSPRQAPIPGPDSAQRYMQLGWGLPIYLPGDR